MQAALASHIRIKNYPAVRDTSRDVNSQGGAKRNAIWKLRQQVLRKRPLTLEKRDDAICFCQEVEKQEVEPSPAPEEIYVSIATALQEAIADEVKQQVENALVASTELVEEAIGQLLQAANPTVLWNLYSVVQCREARHSRSDTDSCAWRKDR